MAPHQAVEDLTSDPVASLQSRPAEQPTAAHPAEEVNPNMKEHSLAEEFKCILSDPRRDEGVKGDKKHAKRESNHKITKRHYHVCGEVNNKFQNHKMVLEA
jgi:hypothetical protein